MFKTFLAIFCTALSLDAQSPIGETALLELFARQSPIEREQAARVRAVRAAAAGRTLYSNPVASYSREGAGLTEFFQVEQSLPLNGRLRLLRQAAGEEVAAAEADGAAQLWRIRGDLRLGFYRLLAAQEREAAYEESRREIGEILRVLELREKEGEGSKLDRLRMQRERADLRSELGTARALRQELRATLLAFLPEATLVERVAGDFATPSTLPEKAALVARALAARAELAAEARRAGQLGLEAQAAERLRYPDPTFSGGLKRADASNPGVLNGPVFSLRMPLPVFQQGKTELARLGAEQDRLAARRQILVQKIRSQVGGLRGLMAESAAARDAYASELDRDGREMLRIATLAYQEGEIPILQLIDAYRTQRLGQLRLLGLRLAAKESQIELERTLGEGL
jgi:outer membrane protein, heavy metal efflux system